MSAKRIASARQLPAVVPSEIPWVDRTSPVPLHAQLRSAIEARIRSGEWAERLPGERRLCALFGVSRPTLRRSLRQLASDGRLVAHHGRGHEISSRAPRRRLLPMSGFPRQDTSDGSRPTTILSVKSGRVLPAAALALHLAAGERVLTLRRLRWFSGRPSSVETIVLPLSRFPGLARERFEDPHFGLRVRRKYGLRPARGLSQWQAVPCPPLEAQLLDVGAESPVFRLRRTSFDGRGRPLEYVDAFLRGDLYGFQAELQEAEGASPSSPAGPVVPFRKS